jgi:hypothetical protein
MKRKRSSAALSSPQSDASDCSNQTSTPLSLFYMQSKPVDAFYQKTDWQSARSPSEDHLNSRTRKRYRDNRPDENAIYGVSCWLGAVINMASLADACRCAATTISKLYEAQRQQPQALPAPSQPTHFVQAPTQPQRNTLHSFWRINHPPVRPSTAIEINLSPRCQDCDSSLQHEDEMELDDSTQKQCQICERAVCDTCAVLGDSRICLLCATQKT